MRAARFYQVIMVGAVALLVGATLLISFSLPGPVSAQPAATRRAELQATAQAVGNNAAATAQAVGDSAAATAQAIGDGIAATVEAEATNVAGTVQAAGEDLATTIAGTAQAAGVNIAATLEAEVTNIAATAQYVVDTVAQQGAAAIQATATALALDIANNIGAQLAALPVEVAQLVEYFLQNSSVDYVVDGNTLTVTSFVSEADANMLLDILVQAAGYDPDAVLLDATAEGTIQVIMVDASGQIPGTLVMTYRLAAVNGVVEAELVSVTLNGNALPLEQVPAELVSAVDLGVMAAAMQTMVGVPVPADYAVQTLSITADGVLITFSIAVTQF